MRLVSTRRKSHHASKEGIYLRVTTTAKALVQ